MDGHRAFLRQRHAALPDSRIGCPGATLRACRTTCAHGCRVGPISSPSTCSIAGAGCWSITSTCCAAGRARRPFEVVAAVVLPDHLHCVWTLPAGDADNPTRCGHIKAAFSRALPRVEHRSVRRIARAERGIWQRRYWEHVIRDDRDLAAHVDYIHFNPVKHGHARRVVDWPHSTFHLDVARGAVAADWGGDGDGCAAGGGGERERGWMRGRLVAG